MSILSDREATRWRHLKRGGTYEIIGRDAAMQCSSHPKLEEEFETTTFVVIRSENTGMVYIRPTEEFFDGRFEPLVAPYA